MVNPVEIISRSRTRLASLAIWQVVLTALLPLIATVALGLGLPQVMELVWLHRGAVIESSHARTLRVGLFAAAVLEAAVASWFALRRWRAHSFEAAAGKIDERVGAHQEILTLAALANPAHPERQGRRSALFAMLWRRAIDYLANFDPRREFRLELAGPLRNSSIFAVTIVVVLGLMMLALARPPTALQAAGYQLRHFASSADSPGATPEAQQLAAAARAVAQDLENPRLPPQQRLAELESLQRNIEKAAQPNTNGQSGAGNAAGSGNTSGQGTGNANGTGPGKGAGTGNGGGAGNRAAAGAGGHSTPKSNGGGGDKGDKSPANDLSKDLDKAAAKLANDVQSSSPTQTAQQQDKTGNGLAPQAGSNPNHSGPQPRPDGSGKTQLPDPSQLAQGHGSSLLNTGAGHKDDKGTQGDTHLGDFPKAANYERFYKLGEKGPAIDVRDARYVTFRLPTATVSGSADGKVIRDSAGPSAITPYTNAPLREQRLAASPDEQQLVPPRYRDLIR